MVRKSSGKCYIFDVIAHCKTCVLLDLVTIGNLKAASFSQPSISNPEFSL